MFGDVTCCGYEFLGDEKLERGWFWVRFGKIDRVWVLLAKKSSEVIQSK